jgi:hypothetical protein
MAKLLLSKGASKEKATGYVSDSVKALIEGFLADLERISKTLRPSISSC